MTPQHFNVEFLKYYEKDVVDSITQKVKAGRAARGQDAKDYSISAEAVYVYSGPIRLAVVRLTDSDTAKQVLITGIVGAELRRIACVRASPEAIPITSGPCGEKIAEVFGAPVKD